MSDEAPRRYGFMDLDAVLSDLEEERNRWIMLFNRLDAAVARHRGKLLGFEDDDDAALWHAHSKVLTDAARQRGDGE